jgi:hypothetical protein
LVSGFRLEALSFTASMRMTVMRLGRGDGTIEEWDDCTGASHDFLSASRRGERDD